MNGFGSRLIRATLAILIALAPLSKRPAYAEEADIEKIKLDLITETADKICNAVSIDGSTTSKEVKGEINAQLSGLASKLASAGVSGTGSLNTETYHNVLQKDLAEVLKDNSSCKLKVFDALQSKLLSANDLRKVPAQDAQILLGTWAGSYQCGTSAGTLHWNIEADAGQITITEQNSRKIGPWLRHGGTTYTATWIPPRLHLLSTTGLDHYSIDLVLLSGKRQLKGNYINHGSCNAVQLVKETG